jgi:hypothetical protein
MQKLVLGAAIGLVVVASSGAGSPIEMERGLNKLWSQGGGIQYAPPIR